MCVCVTFTGRQMAFFPFGSCELAACLKRHRTMKTTGNRSQTIQTLRRGTTIKRKPVHRRRVLLYVNYRNSVHTPIKMPQSVFEKSVQKSPTVCDKSRRDRPLSRYENGIMFYSVDRQLLRYLCSRESSIADRVRG